ncbi:MAG: alpha/beta fold hydrolase [Gammaproteobacteria bacterium]|nr:alpha/beta fold hydrolase [Gammaproteobacteria bacterium]
MAQQHVKFTSNEGQQLSGILDMPDEAPRAFALFAHCFTCSKNLKAVGNISKSLNDAGIAILRFDFTGLGDSEGDFADTNFSSNVSDLLSAANYLKEKHQPPSMLIGHSLGGAAVLQAATDIPSVVAVATIGSPSAPAHVTAMLESNRDEIEITGQATVQLGGRPFLVKRQFLEDIERQALPESISKLRKALLVMHAPLDNVVGIDNASELFLHAKHPKSFISLDKADHLLSREEDSRYAGHVLAAWASRYLESNQPVGDELASDNADTIARTGANGFKTDIVSAGHKLTADEPANVGGTNAGPSPYGLLSAALASCTTMTLQMYAKRKKIDLISATVRVDHAKIHATDCEDCDTQAGKVDEFQRRLTLEGELTNEQRQRLLEIADMCPVHRTLHGEVKIKTELEA